MTDYIPQMAPWIGEEEKVKNLRHSLNRELRQRQFGRAVRLEVAATCPDGLAAFLEAVEVADFGAVALGRLDFDAGRVVRHDDDRRDRQEARGQGDALGVVAG